MMKPFSHQAVLLQAAWNDILSRNDIIDKMLQAADAVLEQEDKTLNNPYMEMSLDNRRKYEWHRNAYLMLFNDGMFDAFAGINTVRCAAYIDYIEEHGNQDDETELLACYWITALSDRDPLKYMPIIRKIMDIAVNGL